MANNKGKKFEGVVKASFEQVAGVSIDRFRDAPRKLKGVDNPSDFVVYKKPHEVYVECKSHKGNTLPFSCIRDEQINGMMEKAKIEGVKAGVIIWFIDHDFTIWVPIQEVVAMIKAGYKSINIKDLNYTNFIKIEGQKKRVYFAYDMKNFLEELYAN